MHRKLTTQSYKKDEQEQHTTRAPNKNIYQEHTRTTKANYQKSSTRSKTTITYYKKNTQQGHVTRTNITKSMAISKNNHQGHSTSKIFKICSKNWNKQQ